MLIVSIVATLLAIGWSVMTVVSNGMSDSPRTPFQGGGLLLLVWIIVASLWLGWYFG